MKLWSTTDSTPSVEHTQRHMEAMVKNLSSTVELLAVASHSDTVKQWDEQTLSRAFHWACYCEHVFHRFHNNPTIRRVMEKQLELTTQSLRSVFPEFTAFSFSDLSRCQHLLLVGLLRNTEVPISIMRILFDSPRPVYRDQKGYQDLTGLCSSIIECKSVCKVLSSLTEGSAVGADAEVQAELLMEKLGTLLKQRNGAHQAGQFLDLVFHECEEAGEPFYLVIAAAFLSKTSSQTDFLLDWLKVKLSLLQHMCQSLPAALLADIAKRLVRFGAMYIDVLKKWATDMEYDINNGEWCQVSRNPTVTFQKLTEHFVSMFKASVSLKEQVETELKALKFSDGDFDVRGLSVWGDLLTEVHKEISLSSSQQC